MEAKTERRVILEMATYRYVVVDKTDCEGKKEVCYGIDKRHTNALGEKVWVLDNWVERPNPHFQECLEHLASQKSS